ncbi:MAG: Holliday junction resolvase RuvX [Acidaminococcaceae bacterium]|nr:Holliday junction resolvase RuvX [Acidaminococcaceae bacterium]
MRTMALDLGTKTIGVAVSDATGLIARGVETIRRQGKNKDFARLDEIIRQEEVDSIVIGYPKNMNGSIGERAKASEVYKDELAKQYPQLKIILWDERLSTVAAEKVLVAADMQRKKRRKIIDMMAAVVILQNYLDSRGGV